MRSQSRMMRGLNSFGHGGGKPEWGSPQNACILWGPRVGGGANIHPRDVQHDRACLNTMKPAGRGYNTSLSRGRNPH